MSQALIQLMVEAEHCAHGLFNHGDLLGSRIAAARDQQHQNRSGVAGIVDRTQWRSLRKLARLGTPRFVLAARRLLADMVDAAHADEPIDHPKRQSADNQKDDRHFKAPATLESSRLNVTTGLRGHGASMAQELRLIKNDSRRATICRSNGSWGGKPHSSAVARPVRRSPALDRWWARRQRAFARPARA